MSILKNLKTLCAALFVLSFVLPAHAATFTVTKIADTNDGTCNADCSLREAITAANAAAGSDTITVASSVTGSVSLNSTLPVISGNLTINGPGAASFSVTRNAAAGNFRIFDMARGAVFSLSDVTVSGGAASKGAGINNDGGTLTVTRCVLQNNIADNEGGGIHNNGLNAPVVATITDTTFKNNQAISNAGGGLFNDARGSSAIATVKGCTFVGNQASRGAGLFNFGPVNTATLTLTNCTISANRAAKDSGGLATDSGFQAGNTVSTVNFCTFSDNVASDSGGVTGAAISSVAGAVVHLGNTIFKNNDLDVDNFGGTIISNGYNLSSDNGGGFLNATGDRIRVDPKLGPLQNNGGPTLTYALATGSPAIDKGKSLGVTTDQRGLARPYDNSAIANASGGDGSDIGAFELQASIPSSLVVSDAPTHDEGSASAPGSTNFTVSLSHAVAQTVTVSYHTTDGSAVQNQDYVAKRGTLTFAPGETTKVVSVKFVGDGTAERNETFYLDLSSPVGAFISDSRGIATISNDDGPSVNVSDAAPVDEGNSGLTTQSFTVTLSAPSANTVRVDWTTTNGTAGTDDYNPLYGTLVFSPGQLTKTIYIQVLGDTTYEPDETYTLNLTGASYAAIADGQGIGIIRNDDPMLQRSETDEPSQ